MKTLVHRTLHSHPPEHGYFSDVAEFGISHDRHDSIVFSTMGSPTLPAPSSCESVCVVASPLGVSRSSVSPESRSWGPLLRRYSTCGQSPAPIYGTPSIFRRRLCSRLPHSSRLHSSQRCCVTAEERRHRNAVDKRYSWVVSVLSHNNAVAQTTATSTPQLGRPPDRLHMASQTHPCSSTEFELPPAVSFSPLQSCSRSASCPGSQTKSPAIYDADCDCPVSSDQEENSRTTYDCFLGRTACDNSFSSQSDGRHGDTKPSSNAAAHEKTSKKSMNTGWKCRQQACFNTNSSTTLERCPVKGVSIISDSVKGEFKAADGQPFPSENVQPFPSVANCQFSSPRPLDLRWNSANASPALSTEVVLDNRRALSDASPPSDCSKPSESSRSLLPNFPLFPCQPSQSRRENLHGSARNWHQARQRWPEYGRICYGLTIEKAVSISVEHSDDLDLSTSVEDLSVKDSSIDYDIGSAPRDEGLVPLSPASLDAIPWDLIRAALLVFFDFRGLVRLGSISQQWLRQIRHDFNLPTANFPRMLHQANPERSPAAILMDRCGTVAAGSTTSLSEEFPSVVADSSNHQPCEYLVYSPSLVDRHNVSWCSGGPGTQRPSDESSPLHGVPPLEMGDVGLPESPQCADFRESAKQDKPLYPVEGFASKLSNCHIEFGQWWNKLTHEQELHLTTALAKSGLRSFSVDAGFYHCPCPSCSLVLASATTPLRKNSNETGRAPPTLCPLPRPPPSPFLLAEDDSFSSDLRVLSGSTSPASGISFLSSRSLATARRSPRIQPSPALSEPRGLARSERALPRRRGLARSWHESLARDQAATPHAVGTPVPSTAAFPFVRYDGPPADMIGRRVDEHESHQSPVQSETSTPSLRRLSPIDHRPSEFLTIPSEPRPSNGGENEFVSAGDADSIGAWINPSGDVSVLAGRERNFAQNLNQQFASDDQGGTDVVFIAGLGSEESDLLVSPTAQTISELPPERLQCFPAAAPPSESYASALKTAKRHAAARFFWLLRLALAARETLVAAEFGSIPEICQTICEVGSDLVDFPIELRAAERPWVFAELQCLYFGETIDCRYVVPFLDFCTYPRLSTVTILGLTLKYDLGSPQFGLEPTMVLGPNHILRQESAEAPLWLPAVYNGGTDESLRLQGRGVYVSREYHYEGTFRQGRNDGFGKMRSKCGEVYEGFWKDGQRHGQGVVVQADGRRLEGHWVRDVLHGRGSMQLPDGLRYEGDWVNGALEGWGIISRNQRLLAVAQFMDGHPHGWTVCRDTGCSLTPLAPGNDAPPHSDDSPPAEASSLAVSVASPPRMHRHLPINNAERQPPELSNSPASQLQSSEPCSVGEPSQETTKDEVFCADPCTLTDIDTEIGYELDTVAEVANLAEFVAEMEGPSEPPERCESSGSDPFVHSLVRRAEWRSLWRYTVCSIERHGASLRSLKDPQEPSSVFLLNKDLLIQQPGLRPHSERRANLREQCLFEYPEPPVWIDALVKQLILEEEGQAPIGQTS